MGHTRGGTFAHYISNMILDDTQSIFMGTPARKDLVDLATHASITRDPSAPSQLTDSQREEIENEETMKYTKERKGELKKLLIERYGQIKIAYETGDPDAEEHRGLYNKLIARRRHLHRKKLDSVREEFFKSVGDQIIAGNAAGKPVQYEYDISAIQPERLELGELEFKNKDCEDNDDELLEDRIRSLEMRLKMIDLNIPARSKSCFRYPKPPNLKAKSDQVHPPDLRCPECLGIAKIRELGLGYTYTRKDTLKKHLLGHLDSEIFPRSCKMPGCASITSSAACYMRHLVDKHNIGL